MSEPEPKRPVGRPVADPSGKAEKVRTSLSPAEREHLRVKYGSVYRGLRTLVQRDMTAKK